MVIQLGPRGWEGDATLQRGYFNPAGSSHLQLHHQERNVHLSITTISLGFV